MHYIFLKNIVDTTIETFLCQSCQKNINDESIRITNINSTGIGMEVICPHCHARSDIRAEIHAMAQEMLKTESGKVFFNEMLQKGGVIGGDVTKPQSDNPNSIKDADIKKVEKDILGASSMEDLLK